MRLFRARKCFRLVALLAFALQLGVSVSHIHPAHARPSKTSALACRTFLPPEPHNPCVPQPSSHDCCPVCLALNLTGPALRSDAPALALPAFARTAPQAQAEIACSDARSTSSFNARAPPAFAMV
jgi:hypothetical protein